MKIKVTPEEAVRIGGHLSCDILTDALALYRESMSLCYKLYDNNPRFILAVTLAAIWNAGRMQGIQEERAKRKRE